MYTYSVLSFKIHHNHTFSKMIYLKKLGMIQKVNFYKLKIGRKYQDYHDFFSNIDAFIRNIMTRLANFDKIKNYHDFSRIIRINREFETLQ